MSRDRMNQLLVSPPTPFSSSNIALVTLKKNRFGLVVKLSNFLEKIQEVEV